MMVTVLGIATIIGMMANDHPRNGGQSRDHLEDFDHFGEGGLPRGGDHPRNGDNHRNGDHLRDGGRLRVFYHPKGWLLNHGSEES